MSNGSQSATSGVASGSVRPLVVWLSMAAAVVLWLGAVAEAPLITFAAVRLPAPVPGTAGLRLPCTLPPAGGATASAAPPLLSPPPSALATPAPSPAPAPTSCTRAVGAAGAPRVQRDDVWEALRTFNYSVFRSGQPLDSAVEAFTVRRKPICAVV